MPLVVESDQEALLQDGLLLQLESDKLAMANRDKVLEVNLIEVKFVRRNLSFAFSDFHDVNLLALAHIVAPIPNGELFTRTLKDEEKVWHFDSWADAGHYVVVESLGKLLEEDNILLIEEFTDG